MVGLTAFPVYPAAWTLPLAVMLGVLAGDRPFAAVACRLRARLPALWNQAEAAALLYAPLAAALAAGRTRWGARCWAPLAAVPLALVGLGPAIVLVAATAPTPRRRALAEAPRAACSASSAGGTIAAASADQSLAGAERPVVLPRRRCWPRPAVALCYGLASAVFAPLLHVARAA